MRSLMAAVLVVVLAACGNDAVSPTQRPVAGHYVLTDSIVIDFAHGNAPSWAPASGGTLDVVAGGAFSFRVADLAQSGQWDLKPDRMAFNAGAADWWVIGSVIGGDTARAYFPAALWKRNRMIVVPGWPSFYGVAYAFAKDSQVVTADRR